MNRCHSCFARCWLNVFISAFMRENKMVQIYALLVAKGGPKMKESPEGATGEGRCIRSFAEREGATLAAVCNHMTSADIAQQLQALAPGYFRDGTVVDMSNLKGVYDFKLEWITAGEANNGSPGPSMFNAVQDQPWAEAGTAAAGPWISW